MNHARPTAPEGGGPFLLLPPSMVRTPALALAAILVGIVVGFTDVPRSWIANAQLIALLVLGGPLAWRTIRGMARGNFASDVVAMLAILTALVLREPIAGLVIVLMQSGGEILERYAEGRASQAVLQLEQAAPRTAHRLRPDALTADPTDIAAEEVRIGDTILVRPGEMLPCDGVVIDGTSSLDTSRLTGEPLPDRVGRGDAVRSGVVNLQSPLVLKATAPASESLYARIVELVRSAQSEKAPIQRLADRWAVWFTPVTLVACGAAWLISGDATRVLAVLVVATPCPLILATPVAIIGGINRAARRQIIVRNGTALEQLADVNVAIFDKTGTLTIGRPAVASVQPVSDHSPEELLRIAGALELGSGHLLARSTVDEARRRGIDLPVPADVVEHAGRGVTGTVDGERATVGSFALTIEQHPDAAAELRTLHDGAVGLRAYVVRGNHALGTIAYADQPREGLAALFTRLQSLGIRRSLLLSGDHTANVEPVARAVGITEARGDLMPQDKVNVVRERVGAGDRVLMVGDGTNDAPALSAATVGIALAAHGGGISAEAAGVVLLADDVTRVADAIEIGQRAVRIARQSIGVGLGLSAVGMVVAALGYIPPTVGALYQEAVDVAVILNALRAARSGS